MRRTDPLRLAINRARFVARVRHVYGLSPRLAWALFRQRRHPRRDWLVLTHASATRRAWSPTP